MDDLVGERDALEISLPQAGLTIEHVEHFEATAILQERGRTEPFVPPVHLGHLVLSNFSEVEVRINEHLIVRRCLRIVLNAVHVLHDGLEATTTL